MTPPAISDRRPATAARVVVAMSGGVDSSLAAALLVEQGYDVVGVSMRLWEGSDGASGSGCCSLDDFLDARRVAEQLGIRFYVMDFRDAFARAVVDDFVDEYRRGRTPNPCARCNQFVKFAAFWERARELGAQWIATGHYARLRRGAHDVELLRGADADKDQSYFLFGVDQAVLRQTRFPVGALRKAEVRAEAERRGLAVAGKPDSQEVCFAPGRAAAGFAAQRPSSLPLRPGVVVDAHGTVLARHAGVHRFTIGQRRGLGVGGAAARYVTGIDAERGVVHVGPAEAVGAAGLEAANANWLGAMPAPGARVDVKIRSRFAPQAARVVRADAHGFEVVADDAMRAVTPGQAAVLYDGERVIGGGWILRAAPRGRARHRRRDASGRDARPRAAAPSGSGERMTGVGRRLRVAFATLGCKVNQYDTGTMETALRERCEIVAFAEGADVYVVNSCTVTDRADAESRQLARRARRLNPRGRVILTGCFAQTSPQRAALPEVDYVVGVGRLPDILRAVHDQIPRDEGRILVHDLRKAEQVSTLGAEAFGAQTRAFLKVQEGCDLFCTFCIVPFARGRSRSVEPRRVLAELQRLAARGFREVVLTGIHLGGYGRDLTPRIGFTDLVEMVAEVAPLPRIRLSSIDPPEVTPRLLELVARSAVLCPHFHVPVQAGADGVLRRMRRLYDSALVRDVAAEIARVVPQAALGTDVIAGFPGESASEFATGVALLEETPFSYFHVFPYSRRTGTTAAKARDHLPPQTIKARAAALRRLGAAKRRAFAQAQVGTELEVLVEAARDRETTWLTGYSRNYARVLLEGPDTLANHQVRVRATACRGERVLAERAGGEAASVFDPGPAVHADR